MPISMVPTLRYCRQWLAGSQLCRQECHLEISLNILISGKDHNSVATETHRVFTLEHHSTSWKIDCGSAKSSTSLSSFLYRIVANRARFICKKLWSLSRYSITLINHVDGHLEGVYLAECDLYSFFNGVITKQSD